MLTLVYYRRVRVLKLVPLALGNRPVLFVGLHRNGAVDGMLYKRVFPRSVFVVARQLLRSRFSRLFFTGIPVAREQDERDAALRRENPRSLSRAVDHLVAGGHLFVLPEGTSDLGPRHLPFKPGAAKILAATMERGVTPLVIPVGIFYESAPSFRSDVCIVLGAPIAITTNEVGALMQAITAALEAIAVEAEDRAALERIETIAAIASEQMTGTRWRVQKTLTTAPLPATMEQRWRQLASDIADGVTAVDRAGVPRFSTRGALWNAAWIAIQSVIVAAASVANLVPLIGAWLAGKRLADAKNTIALWRILVGAPLAALWLLVVVTIAIVTRSALLLPTYGTITMLGLVAYPELCVRWPMFRNALTQRDSHHDVAALAAWSRHIAA